MNQYHTFWKRLFSGLIDCVFFLPLMAADNYIDVSDKYLFILWQLISGILLWIVYTAYFHGRYGQTIGKRVMKIKVFDVDECASLG